MSTPASPFQWPFLQDAPWHAMGLTTNDTELGVYSHWADGSTEIVTDGQETEFSDCSTEDGRLELANTAGPGNTRFNEEHHFLVSWAVPNELRAPLPDALEAAREATSAATLARIASDQAQDRGEASASSIRQELWTMPSRTSAPEKGRICNERSQHNHVSVATPRRHLRPGWC